MSRVRIETAGHVVEVEQDDAGFMALAPAALTLWRATRFRRGPYATPGGTYDQPDVRYEHEHEGMLGFRA